jgi:hypothetical protein
LRAFSGGAATSRRDGLFWAPAPRAAGSFIVCTSTSLQEVAEGRKDMQLFHLSDTIFHVPLLLLHSMDYGHENQNFRSDLWGILVSIVTPSFR